MSIFKRKEESYAESRKAGMCGLRGAASQSGSFVFCQHEKSKFFFGIRSRREKFRRIFIEVRYIICLCRMGRHRYRNI